MSMMRKMALSPLLQNVRIFSNVNIMEKELPLEEQSIKQIYLDSQGKKTYVIPVYQRNYA